MEVPSGCIEGQKKLVKINVGSAWPLGSSVTPHGVNFSIAAPHAKTVELLIFKYETDDYPIETIRLDQKNRSAIGAAFGALIFGTVSMGIYYTDVDTDWFKVFLGAMMLIAVIFNNYIRRKVTESK